MLSYVILAMVLVLAWLSIRIVPENRLYTVTRFGRHRDTLKPGVHLIAPVLDRIGPIRAINAQVIDIPPLMAMTWDGELVTVSGMVRYHVVDYTLIGREIGFLETALLNLAMESLRQLIASLELESVSAQRDALQTALKESIGEITIHKGVEIRGVMIYPKIV